MVWEDWREFCTGFVEGDEDTASTKTMPTIDMSSGSSGDLGDYLGIPPSATAATVNALTIRAYAKIYNEHYRCQDTQTSLTIDETDGTDTTTSTALQKVNWAKFDRFMDAATQTQKGSAVSLPLGTEAPIFGDNMDWDDVADSANFAQVRNASGAGGVLRQMSASSGNPLHGRNVSSGTGELKVDLSQATAATINQLREKFGLQSLAEARQLYGARYSEFLAYQFGVSDKSFLERPTFLGGGKQTVQFSEVLQTGQDFDANTGVGSLTGHGLGVMKSNRYRRWIPRHGVIISLAFVRPKSIYGNGVDKEWWKTTKEDYYTPHRS